MSDLEFAVKPFQEESDYEDEDEAPSLSDFPLTGAVGEQIDECRCSLSESPDLFEFLTPDLNSFSPPSSTLFSRSIKTLRSECSIESKTAYRPSHRRISREIFPNRSNRIDYDDEFPTDLANRGYNRRGEQRRSPPPWYWLALGPSRYPAEAEIKLRSGFSRRQPRSPAKLFPAKEKATCDRSSWRLINALTCKSHRSVAATTPFHPYC